MGNRRKFLRDALAATAAAGLPYAGPFFAAGRAEAATATPTASSTREHVARSMPFLVLVDETLEEAGRFISATVRLRLPARVFAGDAGSVWMREIEPRLASRTAPLAGLTSAPTSFCLEYLARSHGLRLVYRIVHERVDATGPRPEFRHRLAGPAELDGAVAELAGAGAGWPAAAAELLAACPVHLRTAAPLELPDLAALRNSARSVSWLMTPAT